jgi:hypothetical protein
MYTTNCAMTPETKWNRQFWDYYSTLLWNRKKLKDIDSPPTTIGGSVAYPITSRSSSVEALRLTPIIQSDCRSHHGGDFLTRLWSRTTSISPQTLRKGL